MGYPVDDAFMHRLVGVDLPTSAAIIGAAPAAAPASNLAPAQPPKRKGSKRSKGNVDYVAQPVVQKTD